MESGDNKKIVINGKQYYDLEEVPEEFRAAIQKRLDAVNAAGPVKPDEGPSKIVLDKDLKFQGGPALAAVLKLLLKLSPPPAPKTPKKTGFASPEGTTDANLPQPGAIHPSSSGTVLLGSIIVIMAVYFNYLYFFK